MHTFLSSLSSAKMLTCLALVHLRTYARHFHSLLRCMKSCLAWLCQLQSLLILSLSAYGTQRINLLLMSSLVFWLTDNLCLVASLLLLAASNFLKCIVLAERCVVANVLDDEHLQRCVWWAWLCGALWIRLAALFIEFLGGSGGDTRIIACVVWAACSGPSSTSSCHSVNFFKGVLIPWRMNFCAWV